MAKKKRIRVLALCVFRRGDKIFVSEGYDPSKEQIFYRAIGGGVEFGERAMEAVAREVMEEIQAPIRDLVYLGTLENIFVYDGQPGHEVCLIYDGAFVEEYRTVDTYTVEGRDHDEEAAETLYTATWKTLDFFRNGDAPLYPDGLLDLLEKGQ